MPSFASPELCRFRGDNEVIALTRTIDGVPADITGNTYILTVNKDVNPADTANQVGVEIGTVPVGTDGVIEFQPSGSTEDWPPGAWTYDIQQTSSQGRIKTIAKGVYRVLQDVTK